MNTDKNTALYEKMTAEQDKFRDWLKNQPPEEILKHTYEYTVREDILMAMEELDLPQSRAAALLASPSPLADVYKKFADRETSYMDMVRDSIEQRAEAALDAQRERPLYRHDAAYAREQGDARQDYLRFQPLTPEEIHAEAARLLQELRAPDTPNSPHGTHYMARVSPDFLARAGTQAHDQLMALLPFRSLVITGMVDRPGTYVTILAKEDRSKELRQRRPSVRRQLKQEPRPAEKPEKKSPAHKKKEPER